MARDLRQALDQEPERAARAWKPAVNDEIIGRIVRRDQVANRFKPDLPTDRLVIHADSGDHLAVYANHIVLRNKIHKLNPQVGDRIAIRRQADDPDKNYARYRVIVDRATDRVGPADPDDAIPF